MANQITINEILSDTLYHIVHLTCLSDGTNEVGEIKVTKATFRAKDGNEPNSLDLEQVEWNIQGFSKVTLQWHHTISDTICILNGIGFKDFRFKALGYGLVLKDPRSAGGSGNILLTTEGAILGASYDLTAVFKKSEV